MANSIIGLVDRIRKRPGMYLERSSIVNLKSFLDGYYFAIQSNQIDCEDEEFWKGFQEWISKKYKIATSQNWSQIILFFSNDEFDALEKFFELFDEFNESDEKMVPVS